MTLIKAIGKAVWYMTKAGLLYGALLGGLYGIATAVFLGFGTPHGVDGAAVGIFGIAALAGAVVGGGLGLATGVVDGPILVLLMRNLSNETSVPNSRIRRIQAANALLVTIGVLLTIALVMGVDVVIGIETRHPLAFYSAIALIAGGAFWRATGKFADRVLGVSTSS